MGPVLISFTAFFHITFLRHKLGENVSDLFIRFSDVHFEESFRISVAQPLNINTMRPRDVSHRRVLPGLNDLECGLVVFH